MRLPRTIRLDASDLEAFEPAAEPGEWAISGAFAFSDREPALLMGAEHRAFRAGFLGTRSFGWSSLVSVQEIGEADFEAAVEALARHLLERYNAPDIAAARAFAEEEWKFAQSLCERPVGTLIALEREFGPQGIVERFRTVERPS
ncbi:MAG TPA: DUF6505 family protein [Stellaceae bacterium]|nr:DUF6505 family protein [Stellaceae bacterium]HYC13989.1 DUF6505 family protein [Stellaceae bacterium]